MTPYAIRQFVAEDLPILKRITVAAFEPVSMERNIEARFGTIEGRDWQWRKARHIEQDAQRDPNGIFVAEADGQVVGYVTSWIDRPAGIGFIPNLAVDDRVRGHGIGRALVLRALKYFHSQGIRYARIETLEQNPIGQTLYPSVGFQEVARQIHYCMALPEVLDEVANDGEVERH